MALTISVFLELIDLKKWLSEYFCAMSMPILKKPKKTKESIRPFYWNSPITSTIQMEYMSVRRSIFRLVLFYVEGSYPIFREKQHFFYWLREPHTDVSIRNTI